MASIFWHIVILEIHVALEIQFFFVCVYLEGCMVHHFRTSRVFLKTGQLFYMWPMMKAETRIISVERYMSSNHALNKHAYSLVINYNRMHG
jgi:hypothetical protein